ncbi:hypothetical protein G4B88_004827 [Cannabis sativa]|uniref:Uncharacterized protein n=1 Tax=Cannabis sativa TaxID=3483 RepID=A0A7J6FV53_CANSA|nr:hypothetical protein G4B88_004827 [Cannabis sativa]
MSSKKEEKAQVAADRIKAAAMTAAKGLSRAQAERAAAAAARNVNAYGQKEEGPSRWQEKREAKRQMYLMSTEKAVRLGSERISRLMWLLLVVRLHNAKSVSTRALDVSVPDDLDNPDIKEEEEEEKVKAKASVFETDSESPSGTGSDSSSDESSTTDYSSSSDSEEERRRRRRKKKKQKRGDAAGTTHLPSLLILTRINSDSDDRRSKRKSKRHSRKR